MHRLELLETPHGQVAALVDVPDVPDGPPVLLAHGAGLGQHHEWMVATRSRLVDAGHIVMTFDYAYKHAGRRAPDRLPKLLDVHEAAARVLEDRAGSVLLIGKSMGARVGSHLVADGRCGALGLVYLGYPLVPVGKSEPRNTDHLDSITVPQLFISGTRDRMGPKEAIDSVARSTQRGSVAFIADGDHSLTPLKRSGKTLDDSLDTAVSEIQAWISRQQ